MSTSSAIKPTHARYGVLLFTFVAYMIIYFDRVLLGAAGPYIQKDFGFSTQFLGWTFGAYQLGYALFNIPGGWFGDRVGPRWALASVVFVGRIFTALMGMTWSLWSAVTVGFLFGSSESGTFPIATRALSRWMLPTERAFAQGFNHAGSRLGAAITPPLVVFLIAEYGWRMPFYVFSIGGAIWALAWFWFYRDSPSESRFANEGERNLIQSALGSAPARAKDVPWRAILTSPRVWLLCVMYGCYGIPLVFFLTWFFKYLADARGLSPQQIAVYASLPFIAATAGDLCGGWFSDALLKRTGRINFSRRIVAVSGFILCAVMIPAAALAASPQLSIAFFCCVLFGLELTVGNSWAVTLDIGGIYAGSVSAVMNFVGNAAASGFTLATGFILVAYGWNNVFFILAGLSALGALLFSRIDMSKQLLPPPAV